MNEATYRLGEAAAVTPLIQIEDLRKTYHTGGENPVTVLRGISLSIYPGEFVAIMGASGSGKSTLMNILGCLDRPTAGSYRFGGREVSELGPDDLAFLRREAFGFVFQSYNLVAGATATENVEIPAIYSGMPAIERQERAESLLTSLGLSERLTHRPNQLSGGQQQRVSIARALMNGGRIILADEPTGALDSKSGADVMALLRDLADRGHTVILITHDREVAAHARRVIEIRDGEIVSDTGPDLAALGTPLPQPDMALANESLAPLTDAAEAGKMALRALRASIFRTVLTLLGIVIGVASVVAMLAVGEGARSAVLERFGSMGTNLLLVRPGSLNQRGNTIVSLIPADAKAISDLPNILAAVPESQGNMTVRAGNIDYQSSVNATSPELPIARAWAVERGSFFTAEDEATYAAVAVIGKTVADILFPDGQDPLGQFVLLRNVPFQIIGIMAPKGATPVGQDLDDVLFVPVSTGNLRLFGQQHVRSITVAVDDESTINATEAQVSALLRDRHGREDFQIRNMASILEAASAAQETLTVLLGSVAAISLLVGGIGVMNIMLVSVTERTREIGIRMATGARQRNILQQFLTEAVVVSAFGGVIGILLGLAAGQAISMFGGMPVQFTLAPILLAFGCSALTGVVFGFAPAMKAARLDPVVALASE